MGLQFLYFIGQARQDGCVHLHERDVEEEAVRRDALPPAYPLLGVPPPEPPGARAAHDASGEGAPHGAEAQGRLRRVPYPCAPWWPQAAGPPWYLLRQAEDGGCEPAEEQEEHA